MYLTLHRMAGVFRLSYGDRLRQSRSWVDAKTNRAPVPERKSPRVTVSVPVTPNHKPRPIGPRNGGIGPQALEEAGTSFGEIVRFELRLRYQGGHLGRPQRNPLRHGR
jgi:hypothetical protein